MRHAILGGLVVVLLTGCGHSEACCRGVGERELPTPFPPGRYAELLAHAVGTTLDPKDWAFRDPRVYWSSMDHTYYPTVRRVDPTPEKVDVYVTMYACNGDEDCPPPHHLVDITWECVLASDTQLLARLPDGRFVGVVTGIPPERAYVAQCPQGTRVLIAAEKVADGMNRRQGRLARDAADADERRDRNAAATATVAARHAEVDADRALVETALAAPTPTPVAVHRCERCACGDGL